MKGKKTGGRQPGSLNKKTKEVYEILEKHKFNVIEEMILLYQKTEGEDRTTNTAALLLKEIAQYVYPKLSARQHSGPDGNPIEIVRKYKDMSSEELLKLLPEAISTLKKGE